MSNIVFYHPAKLVFGQNCIHQFIEDCLKRKVNRLFILTITPLADHLQKLFQPLSESGIELKFDFSVEEEPTVELFERILDDVREFDPSGIVGIGGGSVMDVAKLLAAQQKGRQSLNEIFGIDLLHERKIWLACMPTTSGTGSEVSPNAILLDEKEGAKKGIISRHLVPDSTYVDPLLTIGVPAQVTAMTGIDALTHCLEAYANRFSHPMVDLYALEGIRLVMENLKAAVENGNDVDARTGLSLGSLYGGMCLGPVNTAAVHALAYPLGSLYKVPHGLSNAMMLPAVMRYNIPSAPERYKKIAVTMGLNAEGDEMDVAMEGVSVLEELMIECRLKTRLSHLGITKNDLEKMATEAMKVQRLLKNNLRTIKFEDAVRIYAETL